MAALSKAGKRYIIIILLILYGLSSIQIAQGFFGFGTFAKQVTAITLLSNPFVLTLGDILGFLALWAAFVWMLAIHRGGGGADAVY